MTDWRHRPVEDRARILKAAAAALRAHAAEYAQYVTAEMGKLIGTSEAEVGLSAAILDYYADHAESFLAPRALAFARLFAEAGAPAGVYTNVFASIDQIGRLIEDPRIAGVTVTGSERAGSAVAERAGRSLKKAVMELGGSDPLISQGLASLDAGDPADPETTLGPLSSQKALDLLLEQIRMAKEGGAEVVLGGERIDRPGYYLQPTILTGIDEKNRCPFWNSLGRSRPSTSSTQKIKPSRWPTPPRSVSARRCSPAMSRQAAGWPGRSTAAWCTSTSPRGRPPRFPSAASRTPVSGASSPSSGSASS
jgi:acyl-CoA reductase-like NAD-dependent aldehyde dehydrogenase